MSEENPRVELTKNVRTCRVRGRPGRYYLLKVYPRKARVLRMDQHIGEDFLVSNTDLHDVQDLNPEPILFPETPGQTATAVEIESEPEREAELPPLPYGIQDLERTIVSESGPPRLVKCYVQGCEHVLRPPARGFHGDLCPVHGIYCHLSGSSTTFVFQDPRRNLITAPDLFASRVRRNPHKTESHRFGYLNSEDALTWNVLRSLQEAKALYLLAQWVTGQEIHEEPLLFLWGLSSASLQVILH